MQFSRVHTSSMTKCISDICDKYKQNENILLSLTPKKRPMKIEGVRHYEEN